MTAVATKKRPAAQLHQTDLATEQVDRAISEELAALRARENVLDEIVRDSGSEEIQPPLNLSAGQRRFISREFGLTNNFEIARLLRTRRAVHRQRARVGNPAVLKAARQRVADALRAVNTTTAAIDDLRVGDDEEIPALARQAKQLQERLAALQAEHRAAEMHLSHVHAQLRFLRDQAPKEVGSPGTELEFAL